MQYTLNVVVGKQGAYTNGIQGTEIGIPFVYTPHEYWKIWEIGAYQNVTPETLTTANVFALFLRPEVVRVALTASIHELLALSVRRVVVPTREVTSASSVICRKSAHDLWNKIRMHSSKMRTTRLLTVSRSIRGRGDLFRGGGVCLGGVCLGGVCLGCLPRVVSAQGVSAWGVSA